ncbi:MAG: hypothetical protein Q9M31_05430 [Mariprofundus sp.]|nr:hypothetical protein [Mariprofundus sp.]
MLISGITTNYERPPAVVVPPVVRPPAIYPPFVIATMQPVSPLTATGWKKHPSRFDSSRQDSYDMHGHFVLYWESLGTVYDRVI